MTTFAEIVDAADRLTVAEQEELVEILRRRIAERNRSGLLAEVQEARAEYAAGQAGPATAREIMDETSGEP